MSEERAKKEKSRGRSAMEDREEHHVWMAIDDLRGDVGEIKTEIASQRVSLQSLATGLRELKTAIETQQQSSKPQWSLVLGGIGVLMSIIISVGGAALAPLYLADSYASKTLHDHMDQPGHVEAMVIAAKVGKDITRLDDAVEFLQEEIEATEGRSANRQDEVRAEIATLDDTLQREMRDLDAVQATRVSGLDDVLQREMRFIDQVQSAKREGVEYRLKQNETSMTVLHELERSQQERLAGLEANLESLREESWKRLKDQDKIDASVDAVKEQMLKSKANQ